MTAKPPDQFEDPEGYALWVETLPECPRCGGTGEIIEEQETSEGHVCEIDRECSWCDGFGRIYERPDEPEE